MRAELPREAFKILICRWSLRTDTYINTRGNSTSAKFFDAVVNNNVTSQCGHSNPDTSKNIVESPFLKTRILNFICKRTNKIQGSTMPPLTTLKPFELTWPLQNEPLIYECYWSVCMQINLKISCFQKTLWLDNLLPCVPVWVSALWGSCLWWYNMQLLFWNDQV